MTLIDEISNQLQLEKKELIRSFDRGEIKKKKFRIDCDELEKKIREQNKIAIKEYVIQRKIETKKEAKRQNQILKIQQERKDQIREERRLEREQLKHRRLIENEKEPKKKMSDNEKNINIKPKITIASLVEKALKRKTIKTVKAAVAKVLEWDSTKDPKAIKRMTKAVINEVKKQKQPRWKGYTWDQENFLLTTPEEN